MPEKISIYKSGNLSLVGYKGLFETKIFKEDIMRILLTLIIMIADLTPGLSMEADSFCTPISFGFPEQGHLTSEMKNYYDKNGFLILKDYLTDVETENLLLEEHKLISEHLSTNQDIVVFSDRVKNKELGDFIEDSMDKIKFFFEENALVNNKLVVEKSDSLMKIGNALGDLNPEFHQVTFRDSIYNIAQTLGTTNPRLCQSALMLKSRKIGAMVPPHQDSAVFYTEPCTTLAFWIPLQDATIENGCLRVIPGSHSGPLFYRHIKKQGDVIACNITTKGDPLANGQEKNWTGEQFIPLVVDKGSLIVFSGKLVHCSEANLSDNPRNAYIFHLIGGNSNYPADNWLHRYDFPCL